MVLTENCSPIGMDSYLGTRYSPSGSQLEKQLCISSEDVRLPRVHRCSFRGLPERQSPESWTRLVLNWALLEVVVFPLRPCFEENLQIPSLSFES